MWGRQTHRRKTRGRQTHRRQTQRWQAQREKRGLHGQQTGWWDTYTTLLVGLSHPSPDDQREMECKNEKEFEKIGKKKKKKKKPVLHPHPPRRRHCHRDSISRSESAIFVRFPA
jgi:phage/plasmid-associated DNA primase